MRLVIDCAKLEDTQELLELYFRVYGNDYPIGIGTDKKLMKVAIQDSEGCLWFVMRNQEEGKLVGSVIFCLDRVTKVAKVTGVVVDPEFRGKRIASKLIAHGTDLLLGESEDFYSVYTTTRTMTVASQLMFLNNGYKPLGIFPNAHKINNYETLTLMGKFRDGVLEKRKYVPLISEKLKPILKFSNKVLGKKGVDSFKPNLSIHKNYELETSQEDEEFEFIFATEFVKNRFFDRFKDNKDDHFFPFDTPNLLISSTKRDLELYAYYSKKDSYSVFIACSKSVIEYGQCLDKLIFQMRDFGISYIEALLRLDWNLSIEYMLENSFLPSAIYPALKEKDGQFYDFILLSRTMQPLDFSRMNIDSSFKPYIDQYSELWIEMHLSTLGVYYKK